MNCAVPVRKGTFMESDSDIEGTRKFNDALTGGLLLQHTFPEDHRKTGSLLEVLFARHQSAEQIPAQRLLPLLRG